jgi:HTH-type transcriptional regulator/antitoxin HigA
MPATAFIPDYAIPPGATLRETLLAQGVTQSAAARTLGLTAHQFRALLSGRRELTADTASRLDALTGIPTTFWTQAQANYAAHRNRINRQLFLRRPRTLAERQQRRILARQAAIATAKDLRDYPESRVPDIMDLVD